jgi:hypothetical protein
MLEIICDTVGFFPQTCDAPFRHFFETTTNNNNNGKLELVGDVHSSIRLFK